MTLRWVYLVVIERKTRFPQYLADRRFHLGRGWSFVKVAAKRFLTKQAAEAAAFKIVMSNPGDLVGKVGVIRWDGASEDKK